MPSTEAVLGGYQVLHLRTDEREPTVTIPPVVRPAVVRVEPPTVVVATGTQQARIAASVFDGLVHADDPDETHGRDLIIGELLTDEARHLDVGLREPTLFGLRTDLLGDPVVVTEEHALQDGDLRGHAARGPKVRRSEHLLGVSTHAQALALQPRDPGQAGRAIAGHRKVDHAIFLAPFARRLGNRELVAKKPLCSLLAAEFVDDCLKPVMGAMSVFRHGTLLPADSRVLPCLIGKRLCWGLYMRTLYQKPLFVKGSIPFESAD